MTRVGIFETGRLSDDLAKNYGDYPQMFRAYFAGHADLEFSSFSVLDGAPLPSPEACGAWIIGGSSAGVYENHPWIPPLEAFVRETAKRSIPTLGICFGHQIMAKAHGGTVVKSDKGRGIGIQSYTLTEAGEKLVPGMTEVNLIAAHQDQVIEPPTGATLLASSDFCSYAALAYDGHGLSFQPHPEYTPAFERDLIETWQEKSPAPECVIDAAMKTLDTMQTDTSRLTPSLVRFLTRQSVF